jgi:hypothetical protein
MPGRRRHGAILHCVVIVYSGAQSHKETLVRRRGAADVLDAWSF